MQSNTPRGLTLLRIAVHSRQPPVQREGSGATQAAKSLHVALCWGHASLWQPLPQKWASLQPLHLSSTPLLLSALLRSLSADSWQQPVRLQHMPHGSRSVTPAPRLTSAAQADVTGSWNECHCFPDSSATVSRKAATAACTAAWPSVLACCCSACHCSDKVAVLATPNTPARLGSVADSHETTPLSTLKVPRSWSGASSPQPLLFEAPSHSVTFPQCDLPSG